LETDGVASILATVITDTIERMTARLSRLVALRAADPLAQSIIQGIHIEGPFISALPGYVGAHPVAAAQLAKPEIMQQLLAAAGGLTRIVTLAPECDPQMQVTQLLAKQNICVAAGHCNPTLRQLDEALDAGLSMFTHLGNGCPLECHRHDNIIQRVLSRSGKLWISFIADGIHIPWPALGNYLTLAGEHAVIVTDAICAAGLGPGSYKLGNQELVVDAAGGTWSADRSHLMGSSTTMRQIENDLRQHLGLTDQHIRMLTSENPQRILEHCEASG
jgi:N-acetylglucosamine-6-phosphate deacetylase